MPTHIIKLDYLNQRDSSSPSREWLSSQLQIGHRDFRHSARLDLAMRLSDFVMDNMAKTNPIQDRFLFSTFIKKNHISAN